MCERIDDDVWSEEECKEKKKRNKIENLLQDLCCFTFIPLFTLSSWRNDRSFNDVKKIEWWWMDLNFGWILSAAICGKKFDILREPKIPFANQLLTYFIIFPHLNSFNCEKESKIHLITINFLIWLGESMNVYLFIYF